MPETFGARLRQRREQQHVTLAAIAERTKIKLSLLEALERDDVSHWPAGIFRRAFIRDYAQAIGLDPDTVAREFLETHPDPLEAVETAAALALAADRAATGGGAPTRLRWMMESTVEFLSRWRRGGAAEDVPANTASTPRSLAPTHPTELQPAAHRSSERGEVMTANEAFATGRPVNIPIAGGTDGQPTSDRPTPATRVETSDGVHTVGAPARHRPVPTEIAKADPRRSVGRIDKSGQTSGPPPATARTNVPAVAERVADVRPRLSPEAAPVETTDGTPLTRPEGTPPLSRSDREARVDRSQAQPVLPPMTNQATAHGGSGDTAEWAGPDLEAAAYLCTELGRVDSAVEMRRLLQEVGTLLNAKGLIIWIWNAAADALIPALACGYSDEVVARLPRVRPDADNATAAAFRSAGPCAVAGDDDTTAALALPLLTASGCAGVFAIELQAGNNHAAAVQALATMFAALFAQLAAGAATPAARPQPHPDADVSTAATHPQPDTAVPAAVNARTPAPGRSCRIRIGPSRRGPRVQS